MSAADTVFYYDGDCGMCVAFVRRVKRLDRRGRVVWTPYQSLDAPPRGIPRAAMEQAAYLVSGAGEISEGFFAIRALLSEIPALAPLARLMSLPGAAIIGQPVYRLIARNRRRIPFCGARSKQPSPPT